MKLSCLVVDDEPMARRLLEQYIERMPDLSLIASLGNPLQALKQLQEAPPDILFLDVQMPELTGISLLKVLKTKPVIVLTTAYSEYALEGYELEVTDYLLKPITFERFVKCVERISHALSQAEPTPPAASPAAPAPAAPANGGERYFFVKDGTKSVRVNFDDITHIEGLKDYVKIHTHDKRITTLQSLKNLLEVLPEGDFVRVHNSYIVALRWIEEVHRDEVHVGGAVVPVSDTYRREFRRIIEERQLK
ncbi:DNA-binding LytR/AlgR family response regulator [Lewinella marina]|uniref:DNA-binding response regulator n=1 Tax=Neolewinella marina TaxID=438751 RepID=A0A2G0CCE0_9BACT|nr:LytTR family DNA-binding domain-containing protein [Neolewinella marina]NJB87709.1 DNA-binding LytR/AlgR family response regulator [Neolewinella marina]PHK97612.1 DNA-binding response regulator [Neolewinella marina]